jgi:hypothetical protein
MQHDEGPKNSGENEHVLQIWENGMMKMVKKNSHSSPNGIDNKIYINMMELLAERSI